MVVGIAAVCGVLFLQGYLPRDLYNLNSAYGNESELRELIQVCHEHNIKVIADIVVNHRYGTRQKAGGMPCYPVPQLCWLAASHAFDAMVWSLGMLSLTWLELPIS